MANVERYTIEENEQWHKWVKEVPPIKFDPEWAVKIIPPFGGAMARFLVEANGNRVSVYLDVNGSLGFMQEPYWEVYPVDGNTARCVMADTSELIRYIYKGLEGGPDA